MLSLDTLLDLCVSCLRRGHANLLYNNCYNKYDDNNNDYYTYYNYYNYYNEHNYHKNNNNDSYYHYYYYYYYDYYNRCDCMRGASWAKKFMAVGN